MTLYSKIAETYVLSIYKTKLKKFRRLQIKFCTYIILLRVKTMAITNVFKQSTPSYSHVNK